MLRLIRILGDRHAGFVLGMVVILNLAVGSLVMDRYPDLYPPFFPNEFSFFFDPVRGEHAWFYALLATITLFGVNLIACIIETVADMLQNRSGRLKPVAALMFHAALALILVAHLHDGIYGDSYQMHIDDSEVEIPGLGLVRTETVQNYYHPDGSLKETEATLFFRLADGRDQRRTIAFNEPALFQGGIREIVIMQGENRPTGLILSLASDGAEIPIKPSMPYRIRGGHLILIDVTMSEMNMPIAEFLFQHAGGRQPLFMVLDPRASRHAEFEIAGERYRYQRPITAPVVMVMVRYNPAIPLVLAGLLLSSIGTILLIRWTRRPAYRPGGRIS